MTGPEGLVRALAQAGVHRPALVLDHDALMHNLVHLAARLPQGYARRVVDKSLPAPDLLAAAMTGLATDRVMSFHLPLTAQVLARFAQAEVLMGKPMPAPATAAFRRTVAGADRVIWLADGDARLRDLAAIAAADARPLRLAFEVDIGLGRGGYATPAALAAALEQVPRAAVVEGLMGYEAHTAALPRLLGQGARAQAAAMRRLAAFVAVLPHGSRRVLNTGGSSTALTLPPGGPGNDLSVGSALLKPSDFDQPCNAALRPALFIVTPVLKTVAHGLPGHPRLSAALRAARLIAPRIAFGYGGKWMARPVWPEGLGDSPFYAPSSNQQGWTLPRAAPTPTAIVLRPTQTEALIPAFPGMVVMRDGAVAEVWPGFPPA